MNLQISSNRMLAFHKVRLYVPEWGETTFITKYNFFNNINNGYDIIEGYVSYDFIRKLLVKFSLTYEDVWSKEITISKDLKKLYIYIIIDIGSINSYKFSWGQWLDRRLDLSVDVSKITFTRNGDFKGRRRIPINVSKFNNFEILDEYTC